jgi:murein DD-endopeptidase MepM/ murein hydrolase activator NlpD
MAKKKPTLVFNPSTLTFEQKKISWQSRLLFGLMIASGVAVFGFIMIMISHKIFPSPKEIELKKQIALLKKQYGRLENHLILVDKDLYTLRKRDENLYRVIYQRDPISNDIWKIAELDSTKYKFRENTNLEVIADVLEKLRVIRNKMKIQTRSYNELVALVARKDEMINSIPSIQPISNQDLNRISSGFGWRIHPIYRIPKLHTGVDFTAPVGTDIIASGNGVVEKASYGRGYGKEIVINHGYGYKTRYAHLSQFSVRPGMHVKRGQKIGAVGSTGASVGPHLHYEVEYLETKIDPSLFFYNDLSADQYEKLIQITNAGGKAFD